MIINTGGRTDIPAFYAKWLINRIREGYVYVRNPYNPLHVTKHELNPVLIGEGQKEDTITIANQKSWKQESQQLSFLF